MYDFKNLKIQKKRTEILKDKYIQNLDGLQISNQIWKDKKFLNQNLFTNQEQRKNTDNLFDNNTKPRLSYGLFNKDQKKQSTDFQNYFQKNDLKQDVQKMNLQEKKNQVIYRSQSSRKNLLDQLQCEYQQKFGKQNLFGNLNQEIKEINGNYAVKIQKFRFKDQEDQKGVIKFFNVC